MNATEVITRRFPKPIFVLCIAAFIYELLWIFGYGGGVRTWSSISLIEKIVVAVCMVVQFRLLTVAMHQITIRRLVNRSVYFEGSGQLPDGKFISAEDCSRFFSTLGVRIASSASDAEFVVRLHELNVTFTDGGGNSSTEAHLNVFGMSVSGELARFIKQSDQLTQNVSQKG